MPRMFPERIPELIAHDPAREAERAVYEALSDELESRYSVFGWVPLLNVSEGMTEREVDFLVLDPQRGYLSIEVKGGAIGRDARGQWTSTDRFGHPHAIRDPYEQAREGQYRVRDKLREKSGWRQVNFPSSYMVVLPDVRSPGFPLGSHADDALTVFAPDLGRIGRRIDELLGRVSGAARDADPPGREGERRFMECFARTFELPMTLGAHHRQDRQAMVQLTEQQFTVLDTLARNRRVLVEGASGTGKTFLALEKARRLAAGGARTLLTCFNLPLADFLRRSAGDVPGLTVASVHRLYFEWATRAGVPAPDPDDAERRTLPAGTFTTVLPRAFMDALDLLPDRFDALVVDEGQDFCAADRDALELALADSNAATVYVFQDHAQSLYPDRGGWPGEGFVPAVLDRNLRNSRGIHALLGRLVPGQDSRPAGPDGPEPQLVEVADDRERAAEVSRTLHRLVHEAGVPPAEIAVLVGSRREMARVVKDGRIGAYAVTHDPEARDGRVLVDSVSRFKGLERDVVILTALDAPPWARADALRYVGAGRARMQLVVIETAPALAAFRAPLPPC
jgi:hypothetical protein